MLVVKSFEDVKNSPFVDVRTDYVTKNYLGTFAHTHEQGLQLYHKKDKVENL